MPDLQLEAAEAMVRIAADSDGRSSLQSTAGANSDFRRALERAPDYGYAACHLFDLEFADGDLDAAETALAIGDNDAYLIARRVQLAVARGDKNAAGLALERLCLAPDCDSEWPLQAADRAFGDAGWTKTVEAIYKGALALENVNPQVATLWVNRWAARPHWGHPQLLGELLARGEVGRKAAIAYFVHLGRTKRSRAIFACVRRHRERLRADTECWGIVGYSLTATSHYRVALDWPGDWADRSDARPWMLMNLVDSLLALADIPMPIASAGALSSWPAMSRPTITPCGWHSTI